MPGTKVDTLANIIDDARGLSGDLFLVLQDIHKNANSSIQIQDYKILERHLLNVRMMEDFLDGLASRI